MLAAWKVHARKIKDTVSQMMNVKAISNVATTIVQADLVTIQKPGAVMTIVRNGWTWKMVFLHLHGIRIDILVL